MFPTIRSRTYSLEVNSLRGVPVVTSASSVSVGVSNVMGMTSWVIPPSPLTWSVMLRVSLAFSLPVPSGCIVPRFGNYVPRLRRRVRRPAMSVLPHLFPALPLEACRTAPAGARPGLFGVALALESEVVPRDVHHCSRFHGLCPFLKVLQPFRPACHRRCTMC